jgi:HK97 family phage prohead protease
MTTEETERQAVPPREGLRRTSPFSLRATDDAEGSDGLTLDGYAAVFNRETVIDSWEGRFKEKIAPGAMKRSFRETPPRVQFDHGHHPLIGSIPIGSVEDVREEVDPVLAPEGGAHIIARLHDNWLVQPVRDAIASGSIDGMSFRFSVVDEQWHDHTGKRITDDGVLRETLMRSWMEDVPEDELPVRTLRQLKVPELGPVVWPAYSDTSVGVRSQTLTIDLARLDDPAQRSKLAQAVLMTDSAETREQEPQQLTEDTSAEERGDVSDNTQQITAPAVETHELTARHHARLSELAQVRHTLSQLSKENRRD